MSPGRALMLLAATLTWPFSGCATWIAPEADFPSRPFEKTAGAWRYDVDGNGATDFALLLDGGRADRIGYDDDEDGRLDRIYRLGDYDSARVPHLVLMLDSIPYRLIRERFARGDWPWFAPPAKVVPPFPTCSEVIFTQILQGVPQPGMISRHYDRREHRINNLVVKRWFNGERVQMDERLHYATPYREMVLTFLDPRGWMDEEFRRVRKAFDRNLDRVTLAYVVSSTGMVCAHGEAGAREVLDRLAPFCLRLLHERQGAVKISVLSDHGHTFEAGRRVDLDALVRQAGFDVVETVRDDNDVAIDMDGLLNYTGVHTRRPDLLAERLMKSDSIQLATYLSGDRVVVRDAHGRAAIDYRAGRYRYRPIDRDVLGYGSLIASMQDSGAADAAGFADASAWLHASADHRFPDAPFRLWRAFHGQVINTPDLMITFKAPYYAGPRLLDWMYDMASVHGGLDQVNSAAFVMSMTGRGRGPLRSADVLRAIEPGYTPPLPAAP